MTHNCKICNKEAASFNSLSKHLKAHKLSSKEYYDKYLGGCRGCETCGNPTDYRDLNQGYSQYCSNRCSSEVLKYKQWDDPERRSKLSAAMKGNTISRGRPLGSKNVNPYPMTDAVIRRIKDQSAINGRPFPREITEQELAAMDRGMEKIINGVWG
jgi:endogenous inhibitor of DNA gyrase (YacG/DUF329 family)